jgi:hypothetical protein
MKQRKNISEINEMVTASIVMNLHIPHDEKAKKIANY